MYNHSKGGRCRSGFLPALCALLAGLTAPLALAETAGRAILMNGQSVPGWAQRVEDDGLVWKTADGRIGSIPLQNLREVQLVAPEDFQTAVAQLAGDSNQQALRLLAGYADPANPENYHPVPGNLASRATLALVQHYRTQGQPAAAAEWARAFDPDLLPQADPVPLLPLYRAFASPPDAAFFDLARGMRATAEPPRASEIDFLVAVAHEINGQLPQALAAYGRVFSPAGSLLNPFGDRALDRSIRLLENAPPGEIPRPDQLIKSLQITRQCLYGSGE